MRLSVREKKLMTKANFHPFVMKHSFFLNDY